MDRRAWTSYLLLLLIALQSLGAVADVHRSHESSSVNHVDALPADELGQVEDLTNGIGADTESESANNSFEAGDCQHCCHCHSVTLYYSSAFAIVAANFRAREPQTEYSRSADPGQITTLLRPPTV